MGMTTTSKLITRDRAPDYHIGANGIPQLTQVITVGSRMRKMNSHHQHQQHFQQHLQPTDPVKLNKCLYNLTVRNGQSDKPAANSSKIESDIAIRNTQYSSGGGGGKSSSSLSPALNSNLRRSSPTTVTSPSSQQQVATRTTGDPRRSNTNTSHQFNSSPSIPRSSNNNSSSRNNNGGRGSPPRTLLLGGRQRYQQQQQHRSAAVTTGDDGAVDGVDANLINAGGDRRSSAAVVRQYNRLSAAIDNRLSYQRKYDRTIFGCNRLDQFVLPPLQI